MANLLSGVSGKGRGQHPMGGRFDGSFEVNGDVEAVKRRIAELQVEHRDLDAAIEGLIGQGPLDELRVRRLKKRKLQIKDAIVLLQMQLTPDIPA
jgi:hypothetical protein